MKQGEEGFEFVKEKDKDKGNYILKKDKLTKNIFYFVALVLIMLVLATIFIW